MWCLIVATWLSVMYKSIVAGKTHWACVFNSGLPSLCCNLKDSLSTHHVCLIVDSCLYTQYSESAIRYVFYIHDDMMYLVYDTFLVTVSDISLWVCISRLHWTVLDIYMWITCLWLLSVFLGPGEYQIWPDPRHYVVVTRQCCMYQTCSTVTH